MRLTLAVTLCALGACAPIPDPAATELPLFGNGYRFDGDVCRRVGENADTNQYLDDAADLVACPTDAEITRVFVTDSSAREVGQRDGYTLFSVPLR